MHIYMKALAGWLLAGAVWGAGAAGQGAAGEAVDRRFAQDLYPPVVELGEPEAWVIDQALLDRAAVAGHAALDAGHAFGGQPTLRLQPEPPANRARAAWTVPVEAGRVYRFSALYRSSGPVAGQGADTLGPYGFLALRWLGPDGRSLPIRDKLMSRPGAETGWTLRDLHALTPPGATHAELELVTGWHVPHADAAGWFADLRWGPAQPAPIELALRPRVLRAADEPLTIRVDRTYPGSLTTDAHMRVELRDPAGRVRQSWMAPMLITLPWEVTVRLPDDVGRRGGWTVAAALEPVREQPGYLPFEVSEPVLVASSDVTERLRDGRFVIDGRKRFLIGAYHAEAEDYPLLAGAGFNVVFTKDYDAAEALRRYDQLAELGLHGIASLGGGGQTAANAERVRGVVTSLADHPALLLWDLQDEPTRKGIGPREIAWYSQWVQSLTPHVPTTVNCAGPYVFHRFAGVTDVFSVDPYPVYFWSGLRRPGDPPADLGDVTRWMTLARQHVPEGRAFMGVVECFTFDRERMPAASAEELRNTMYQVAASGAAMVLVYSVRDAGWYLPDEPQFEALKTINAELAALEPWLITQPLRAGGPAVRCDRPDRLVHATWQRDDQQLTMLINLDRAPLDVTLAGEAISLEPLGVRTIEHLAPQEDQP